MGEDEINNPTRMYL